MCLYSAGTTFIYTVQCIYKQKTNNLSLPSLLNLTFPVLGQLWWTKLFLFTKYENDNKEDLDWDFFVCFFRNLKNRKLCTFTSMVYPWVQVQDAWRSHSPLFQQLGRQPIWYYPEPPGWGSVAKGPKMMDGIHFLNNISEVKLFDSSFKRDLSFCRDIESKFSN